MTGELNRSTKLDRNQRWNLIYHFETHTSRKTPAVLKCRPPDTRVKVWKKQTSMPPGKVSLISKPSLTNLVVRVFSRKRNVFHKNEWKTIFFSKPNHTQGVVVFNFLFKFTEELKWATKGWLRTFIWRL